MPKINVYLPDDLAAAVREAGVPVSPVCQQALTTAVRAVNDARRAIKAIRDPDFDPAAHPELGNRVRSRMTARLIEVLRLAGAGSGQVGTAQLLLGVINEGGNMGLRVLQALDIDSGELAAELQRADGTEPFPSRSTPAADGSLAGVLTLPAWRAFAAAAEAGVELAHNYLGCEHLVIGLIVEVEGVAGNVLRRLGATPDNARKTLNTMMSGYAHGKQATMQAGTEALGEIMRRLDALETKVSSLS